MTDDQSKPDLDRHVKELVDSFPPLSEAEKKGPGRLLSSGGQRPQPSGQELAWAAIKRVDLPADSRYKVMAVRASPWDPRVFVEVSGPDGTRFTAEIIDSDDVDSVVTRIEALLTMAKAEQRLTFANAALALAGHEVTDPRLRDITEQVARGELTAEEAVAEARRRVQG